jgi:hypothetical protein
MSKGKITTPENVTCIFPRVEVGYQASSTPHMELVSWLNSRQITKSIKPIKN